MLFTFGFDFCYGFYFDFGYLYFFTSFYERSTKLNIDYVLSTSLFSSEIIPNPLDG